MKIGNVLLVIATIVRTDPVRSSIGDSRVISSDRVTSKDVTPAIGRGYSVDTGNILATCLNVNMLTDVTQTSFDYDYTWSEINSSSKTGVDAATTSVSSRGSTGRGWLRSSSWVRNQVEQDYYTSSTDTHYQYVVTVMKMDKYHISGDESRMDITTAARTVLEQLNIVAFFKSCGPNYMRSIRRSSEVVASFRYHSISGRSESTSSSIISSTFNSVNYSLWSGKTSTSSSNTSVELAQTASNSHEETVVLRIAAFGVTLRSGQALIARDFGEYKNVMDAAFVSMTHPAVGDVVSVEIMPWVANINFQVALTLDNPIRTGPDDNTPAFMRRFNLIVNAEHVARMDDIVQKRTQMIGKVSKCIRRLNFYPRDFNSRKLKSNAECTPGETCDSSMTIGILKAALVAVDDNDTYLVDRMARRLNEYVRNYFAPCMSDMAEVVSGVSAGGMQTKHWSDMTHCQEMSCVFPSVDWVAASRTCRATTVETGTTLVESYCYPVLQ